MKVTNLYIGFTEKIYKKDISGDTPTFKSYPERQTIFNITKDEQKVLHAEDLKYGGFYQVGITSDNEAGDYIVSIDNLTPMFNVDLSDPIFQDEKNLEIDKGLVLKLFG